MLAALEFGAVFITDGVEALRRHILEQVFQFATLVELPDDLEATHETFAHVELRCDPILTVVKEGWLDLLILVKVEAIQRFPLIIVLWVTDDVHKLF